MDVQAAVEDILLGASLRQIAAAFRQELIEGFQFRPEEVTRDTLIPETMAFMKKLSRHLGERHGGDARVLFALREWVNLVDHYEAWDALLSGFEFAGKAELVRRGRLLFPGTMTAHWTPEL